MKIRHPLFPLAYLELAEEQPLAKRLTLHVLDRFHAGADVSAILEIGHRELLKLAGDGEEGLHQKLVDATSHMMSAQVIFEGRGEFKRLGLADEIGLSDDTLRFRLTKNAAALISAQL